jgi:hypothetical protein
LREAEIKHGESACSSSLGVLQEFWTLQVWSTWTTPIAPVPPVSAHVANCLGVGA